MKEIVDATQSASGAHAVGHGKPCGDFSQVHIWERNVEQNVDEPMPEKLREIVEATHRFRSRFGSVQGDSAPVPHVMKGIVEVMRFSLVSGSTTHR